MIPKKILLIRLSSIGDVLHGTPVAKTLREHFPSAEISWIVGEKSQDILHGNPYLDKIILWQREQWEKELRQGAWRKGYENFRFLERQLRLEQYDLTIDMQGLLLTGLIGWRSGAKTRIGFAQAKEGSPLFYTHRVETKEPMPIVNHYLQLLKPLGINQVSTSMVMPVAAEHNKFADNLFISNGITKDDTVVILNPATSWITKCWPAAYFSILGNLLQQKLKVKIILLGAPGDIPLLDSIISGISGAVINLAGKTNLKELAAVIQKAQVFIGGDTGPLHIAAAVGTPTISLFGPTNPSTYAPLGEKHVAIVSEADCRFCFKRKCANLICMEKIMPDDVCLAAQKLLAEPQKRNMEAIAYGQVPVKTIYAPV
jgi:lipopolysaccharide heptosyltransferase I